MLVLYQQKHDHEPGMDFKKAPLNYAKAGHRATSGLYDGNAVCEGENRSKTS